MKKIIVLTCILLTACEFKTNVVLPEKTENEKEIAVIKTKIEMAEKEIKLLFEINDEITEAKFKSERKIYSKPTTKHFPKLLEIDPDFYNNSIEQQATNNSERIYKLMDRIQEWNERLRQLY